MAIEANLQPGHAIAELMLQVSYCPYCGDEPQCLTELEGAVLLEVIDCPLAKNFSETAPGPAFELAAEEKGAGAVYDGLMESYG